MYRVKISECKAERKRMKILEKLREKREEEETLVQVWNDTLLQAGFNVVEYSFKVNSRWTINAPPPMIT